MGIFFNRLDLYMGSCISQQSRVRSLHGLRFDIYEYNGQGHLANDERVFIKQNIVYRKVLNLIKFSTYVCQSSMNRIFLIAWFFVSIKNI